MVSARLRRSARPGQRRWVLGDNLYDFIDEEFDEDFNRHPPTSEGLDYLHNSGVHLDAYRNHQA